jgi:hypothetical protein
MHPDELFEPFSAKSRWTDIRNGAPGYAIFKLLQYAILPAVPTLTHLLSLAFPSPRRSSCHLLRLCTAEYCWSPQLLDAH